MIDEQIFESLVKRLMNAARDIEHEAAIEGHSLILKISTGVNEEGAGYVMFVEDNPAPIALADVLGLPPLDEPPNDYTADTDEMTVPDNLLTGDAVLPVEDFLSDHEKTDYRARRKK